MSPSSDIAVNQYRRPWNTIPFYPEEGSEEWSCGWWAFRTTLNVKAGEELIYDHSFWGYDMAYVDGIEAPDGVPSPFKKAGPAPGKAWEEL